MHDFSSFSLFRDCLGGVNASAQPVYPDHRSLSRSQITIQIADHSPSIQITQE